ncbi:hypothetical protein E2C01_049163 [Portunus trituberculatus]|uniref:Uncharacterized protein n=1 Tax=Portunus trituberculatus TaxID=210409 RepID=A0A5B7G5G2_PORTR|nr:hypothetical protein [Portunus trituberculatus]
MSTAGQPRVIRGAESARCLATRGGEPNGASGRRAGAAITASPRTWVSRVNWDVYILTDSLDFYDAECFWVSPEARGGNCPSLGRGGRVSPRLNERRWWAPLCR